MDIMTLDCTTKYSAIVFKISVDVRTHIMEKFLLGNDNIFLYFEYIPDVYKHTGIKRLFELT